ALVDAEDGAPALVVRHRRDLGLGGQPLVRGAGAPGEEEDGERDAGGHGGEGRDATKIRACDACFVSRAESAATTRSARHAARLRVSIPPPAVTKPAGSRRKPYGSPGQRAAPRASCAGLPGPAGHRSAMDD